MTRHADTEFKMALYDVGEQCLPGPHSGTCALYTEGNFPLVGNLTCTPSAVRKEAVKHGKHVWLYPGGYNMVGFLTGQVRARAGKVTSEFTTQQTVKVL